jgi:hypothetical protein
MRPVVSSGEIFHLLRPGEGAAVLVADFQALKAAPRLSRLISDIPTGHRIYQVDPRGALGGDRLYASLPDLADEAVAAFRSAESSAGRRVFIVSHCSAASLSLQIADRLSDAHDVTAILAQPSWPGTDHITERFADFQAKLGATERPCPGLEGDPWSGVAEMERLMRDGLAELAQRHGLDAAPLAFAELLVSYRTWLAFLLSCRNDQPARPPADGVRVSVLTDEVGFMLPGTDPGRCRITPPPPAEQPDDVTPALARLVLEHVVSYESGRWQ